MKTPEVEVLFTTLGLSDHILKAVTAMGYTAPTEIQARTIPFLLEKKDTYQTSFKKLIKSYKSKSQQQDFIRFISNQIESLIINPYPAQSRTEPLPGGIRLPDNLQFYKSKPVRSTLSSNNQK